MKMCRGFEPRINVSDKNDKYMDDSYDKRGNLSTLIITYSSDIIVLLCKDSVIREIRELCWYIV